MKSTKTVADFAEFIFVPTEFCRVFLSVGRTASSKPPYASHTLVQINQNSQPKSILLKSYFQIDRMQIRYFL